MSAPRLPLLMGVVNATPDSFSDGGAFLDPGRAIDHALTLAGEGAAFLDVGGESTRPCADEVAAETELARVLPVVKGLAGRVAAAISIDTRKPEVARAAIAAGASIWNDVSALRFSQESLRTAAALGCRIVLMHAQGSPKTMQLGPRYDDVAGEIEEFFKERMAACAAAGIDRRRLILDPGIGFGKTLDHNLALLAAMPRFARLGPPVLIGASRKRFIAALEEKAGGAPSDPGARLGGSIAAALAAAAGGAAILRVHDVAATRQALAVHAAIAAISGA
jgi:dihydropteroate synthase